MKAGELRASRIQKIDVVFSELRCRIEISLTERRSSAAASLFCQRNLEAKRFQHFHRSDSDMRLVIAHEGVVPEDHFAALL